MDPEEEEELAATSDSGFVTPYQTPLVIPISVLLANDSPGSEGLIFFDARYPEHGEVEWGDGVVVFTPARGYAGLAEFVYYIADGNGGIDATNVYLTVGSPFNGTALDDFIVGTALNDKLLGHADNDRLEGFGGNDRLYGGGESDRLVGGDGNDVLYGDNPSDGDDAEGFADTFVFDDDDGSDKVFDFEVGLDKVELTDGTGFSLEYTGSGNTILTYGLTTVVFYDAHLTAADVEPLMV